MLKLRETFDEENVVTILKIPLPSLCTPDIFLWVKEMKGKIFRVNMRSFERRQRRVLKTQLRGNLGLRSQ